MFSKVVLPAPLGPIMENKVSCFTSKLTSFKAFIPPNLTEIFFSSNIYYFVDTTFKRDNPATETKFLPLNDLILLSTPPKATQSTFKL